MIHKGEALLIEAGSQHGLGNGQAYRVGKALAQGTSGGFHARRQPVLRVARGFGLPLAEALNLLHTQVIARHMQQGVDEGAGMPVAEYKAVPVVPGGVLRVMPHGF